MLALRARWPESERAYRRWACSRCSTFALGHVQFVSVSSDVTIANMVCQHGINVVNGVPPIRYEALQKCLQHVAKLAVQTSATVHMPRIGCGLAGGHWTFVEPIVDRELSSKEIKVYVYDYVSTA